MRDVDRRVQALERAPQADPVQHLSDDELIALSDIARLQLAGLWGKARARFNEQPALSQERLLTVITSLKGSHREKS